MIRDARDGPLAGMLLVLTVGTGVVDATSIIALGRVFVANMTGNVVFIGFGLVGAPGFSVLGSLVALLAFILGAALGGEVAHRRSGNRGVLLRDGLACEVVLMVLGLAIAASARAPLALAPALVVLAAEGVALGVQNAVVRRLGVPDMTTTVLTLSITGIGADLRRRDGRAAARRGMSVVAMLVGAAAGALIVLRAGLAAGLLTQCVLLGSVLVAAAFAARGVRPWHASR